ncbi:hypothetical protein GIB67_036281 [Kingdonia uniflora]|uniref:Uncharacterized protein n=1 Tax=Kingdonia uniflora TaxID=39325 RepID=A0A7J7L3X0_9MAGN|nr:hypothetical protein GIB67_036281 [Kingdonia uniflora]
MEKQDFNLREWAHKARISRENTFSRRFSGSNIISLGEETRSFRSNLTISSTASSPGYTLRDEIDPNTYSFTNALKALQARTISRWECLSPDGFALNSKWNDAEKYICNPLSGEVPVECLSAKTLSGRVRNNSRSFTSRLTMSGPLLQSNNSNVRIVQPKSTIAELHETLDQSPIQDNKVGSLTRDVGTQSTPPDVSSSSPSPTSTPSAKERPLNHWEAGGYSPDFRIKANSKEELRR